MKKQTINRNTIRFRRWTRKGYSIFCSLNRQITIGVLNFKIATSSIKKQSKEILTAILNLLSLDNESLSEKEREGVLENELILQTINIVNSNVEDKAKNALSKMIFYARIGLLRKLIRAFLFMVQDKKTVGVGLVPTFRTV